MNWKFKLSRRLAMVKAAVLTAAALSACAADRSLTDPAAPSTDPIDPVVVASIAVSPKADSIGAGATAQLTATLRDASGASITGSGIAWASSDNGVASVSTSGLVTAGNPGTAIVIAAIGGKTDSATVTVTAAPVVQPPTTTGPHAGYHVSTSGTSGGNGTEGNPWDIRTALAGAGGKIVAGDTVWFHAGTYTGSFRETVSGQSGKPVVFRQYPGERAIIDGAGTPGGAQSVWYVGGSYVEFWDFEITDTDGGRTTTSLANNVRPNVVANYASHTKYINLVVHDGGVAFYNEPAYGDVEITGCIIYNNGWQSTDRGHGHALYLKNDTGLQVVAQDNVIFNQFGYGVHLYSNAGSGANNNMRIEKNVAFNNGALATNSTSANMLMGGENMSTNDVFTGNQTYYTPGKGGTGVQMGYQSTSNGSLTLTDNYFAGGSTVMSVGFWSNVTMSNNTLIGTSNMTSSTGNVSLSSGLSLLNSLPSATKVFVNASPRQAGRANIVVYNWGGQGSVTVNLAGIVPAGAHYEIHNAQNFYGAPVASGTGGGSATLSMAGVSAPSVVGMGNIAPSTGSQFAVFVVVVS
jgi:hypothetical protein